MRSGIWRIGIVAALAVTPSGRTAWAQAATAPPLGSADATTNEAKARAQQCLDRGNQLLNERAFEKALAEFRAAYGLFPSPKILFNEAEAERELGKFVDAAAHYDAFLRQFVYAESDEDVQRIEAAKDAAQAARAKIATIDPDAPKGVEIVVDARSFGTMPLAEPLRVDPGYHLVTFRRAGLRDSNRAIFLSLGERLRVKPDPAREPIIVALEPPIPVQPPKPLWRRWPFWAVAGAAVVGGVAAIFLANRSDRPPCTTGAICTQGD